MAHNKVDDERIEIADYVFRKAGYLQGTLFLRTDDNTRWLLRFCFVSSLAFRGIIVCCFAKTRSRLKNWGKNKKHITRGPATDKSIKTDRLLEQVFETYRMMFRETKRPRG